jgi:hypothetical protein
MSDAPDPGPARDPEPDQAAVCHDPVFILTASRSGSTLLRFILDTHPEFACPPETMITAACVSLLRSSDILENAGSGHQRLVTEAAKLTDEAMATVRDTVDRIYGRYLARRGKPRWCDKSLDNLLNAELLAQLYPRARFVCLFRHCMDVIASGVEVCPWGVSRFGFDPYVAEHPGNTVAAIGGYWADCAQMILAFEQSQPGRCWRIRYEDLVTAPEEVAAGLLTFLGAAPAPGITAACFDTPHEGDGPGDEKIWFTTKVSAETLGRGVTVPAAALPGSLRTQINATLGQLGYRAVTDDWNKTARQLDPRLPSPVTGTGAGPGPDQADGAGHPGRPPAPGGASGLGGARGPGQALAPVVRALDDRIRSRGPAELAGCVVRWPVLAGQTITLVVTGDGQPGELTCSFPALPAANGHPSDNGHAAGHEHLAGPGEPAGAAAGPAATMIAASAVWQALLDGRANMITEIRHGRLRCLNSRDAHRVRSDEVHALAWLLGLAQVPLARQPG